MNSSNPLQPEQEQQPNREVKTSEDLTEKKHDSESSDILSDENEKDLANFFKSGSKFSKKNKKTAKPAASQQKSTNPFEASNEFDYKTFAESLKPERLASLCKPDDWQILSDSEARVIVAEVATSSSVESLFNDDSRVEVCQKRATDLLLQAKSFKSMLLLPQLAVDKKVQVKAKDLIWYTEFQVWRFNQNGLIYNSFFKQMCLSVKRQMTVELEVSFKSDGTNSDLKMTRTGYLVTLASRNDNDIEQKWGFSKYGTIVSRSLGSDWCLTSKKVLQSDLEKSGMVESHLFKVGEDSGGWNIGDVDLVVMEAWQPLVFNDEVNKNEIRLKRDLAPSQHWAIKQDKREAKMNREWKHSVLATSK